MSNVFALVSIILTALLFTTLFSLGAGLVQITEEQTMRQVGTRGHAGLKNVTREQYEKISAHPLVKEHSYNIFIGSAMNAELIKRRTEIRYSEPQDLKYSFVSLKEGRLPDKENEIVLDSIVMDLLGIPHEVGKELTLSYTFMGKKLTDSFLVSGWYTGDMIAGASEVYVSRKYFDRISKGYSEEDFVNYYPLNSRGVGLFNGTIMFRNSLHIEDNVRRIIEESGYSPDEINYGVNWAYFSEAGQDFDGFSLSIIIVAFLVIMLTGYLIIYNIFQISIIRDIRFYGLLKTIGATKKQIKYLVLRQALLLSLVGIPVGLLLGFGIGNLGMPMFLKAMDSYSTTDFHLNPQPAIFLFGAFFSLITVFLSCRKPGKIAGSVSPVEAAKYTEVDTLKKKTKRTKHGARLYLMALSNLRRNSKKTVVTILSLSLSIILLTEVVTFVRSFSMDEYLEKMLSGDFMINSLALTNYGVSNTQEDLVLPQEFYNTVSNQNGIEKECLMYTSKKAINHTLSEKGQKRYQELYEQGLIEDNAGKPYSSVDAIHNIIDRNEPIIETRYSYDAALLEKLKVVDGELDIEKFKSGNYVILALYPNRKETYYQPGDRLKLQYHTNTSKLVDTFNQEGNYIRSIWSGDRVKEYEVMAIVNLPGSMTTGRYALDCLTTILPKEEFLAEEPDAMCFRASFWVEDELEDSFQNFLEAYTTRTDPNTNFSSKKTMRKELDSMSGVIGVVGEALSFIIGIIGILNFINTILTSVLTRKQELTMLQSIGLTNSQLKRMLIYEGLYYILFTAIISLTAGSALSLSVVKALDQVVSYFNYQFTAIPFVIVIPIFLLVGILVPEFAYRKANQQSIVQRLREAE